VGPPGQGGRVEADPQPPEAAAQPGPVRSIVQRWRPGRSEESIMRRASRERWTTSAGPLLLATRLAWIHRDQFVHYIQLAHALGDPGDWSRFREDLMRALTAAFGLDAEYATGQLTPRQRNALEVLDKVWADHDPTTDWPAFFNTLWNRRHAIRPDLPAPDLVSVQRRADE
jgi:hypothetical protein